MKKLHLFFITNIIFLWSTQLARRSFNEDWARLRLCSLKSSVIENQMVELFESMKGSVL